MTSFIGELYLVWTIEISMQSILRGLVQTVNSDRDVFWVLSDSHYHELLWRELAWIIIIACRVFVALLLFYYYSGQSGFEFFQVSRCLDLGLNHFGNFSYSIMKALNLWKFHLGRSGLKNVVGA